MDTTKVTAAIRHAIKNFEPPYYFEYAGGTLIRRQMKPLAECPSEGAARRHRRNDEPVCGPCAEYERKLNRDRKAAKRSGQ